MTGGVRLRNDMASKCDGEVRTSIAQNCSGKEAHGEGYGRETKR